MKRLMKNLCRLVVLLAIIFVVLGFFRKWFQLASESTEQTIQVNLTIDKKQLLEDTESAQERARDLYQQITGKGGKESAEAVKQPSEKKPAEPVKQPSEEQPAP